jgi:hypothetical protein
MKKTASVLVALAVLATWFWWEDSPPATPELAAVAQGETKPGDPAKTPNRVPLPRPALKTRTSSDADAEPASEPDPLAKQAPPSSELDRAALERPMGELSEPVAPELAAVAIDRTIRDILPEMTRCLNAWGQADVTFDGSVVLGFELGTEGLTEVWIEEVENVPGGPLTCLSATIWEAPWPAFAERTTVNYPFIVEIGRAPDTGE